MPDHNHPEFEEETGRQGERSLLYLLAANAGRVVTREEILALFPDWRGVRLLAAVAQGTAFLLVLRSNLAAQRNDLRVLRGLRIGAGPEPGRVLMHLLRQAGIDLAAQGLQIVPVPGIAEAGASTGVNAARALAEGHLDGFWANGLAAQVAVHSGIGEVILDARCGDGPPGAGNYTFTALATTEAQIQRNPSTVEALIRGVVRAQAALRADPARARYVGARLLPPLEAELIDQVVQPDAVFYSASITDEAIEQVSQFAHSEGFLCGPVPYDHVVAADFRDLWST